MSSLKQIAKSLLPTRLLTIIQSVRGRRHSLHWLQEQGVLEIDARIVDKLGPIVQSGPFAGLEYIPAALKSRHAAPNLLGIYESHLWPAINSIDDSFELIVDIGAAEGYYAVGLARRCRLPVYAFEANPFEARICKRMAVINGVSDRVRIRSWCDHRALSGLVRGQRAFVLSDCEGYEYELFEREIITALRYSDVLIELHGDDAANAALVNAFASTHTTKILSQCPAPVPETLQLVDESAVKAINEYRMLGQLWLHSVAKEHVAGHLGRSGMHRARIGE